MSRLPESRLHIAGTGPYEKNLEELAKKLNLNNVEFLGYKTGMELENEYKYSIANILPCNWFENFPTGILESFIYGKPVIASNVGGIPGMINNNETGILFEPGNVVELKEAIQRLHSDLSFAVQMGMNARAEAELKFHPQIYYQKLLSIYESLVKDAAK